MSDTMNKKYLIIILLIPLIMSAYTDMELM